MLDEKDVKDMELRAKEKWEEVANDMRESTPQDTWDQHKLNAYLDNIKPVFLSGFVHGWSDGLQTVLDKVEGP